MIDAMARIGSPFQGVLYAGLMIVKGIPYVLEFNARMGDPETQVVLPLLKTDFLDVIEAVIDHRLEQLPVEWSREAAVCVVMTSGGYPGAYQQGMVIADFPRPLLLHQPACVSCRHCATDKDIITAEGVCLVCSGWAQHSPRLNEAYRVVNTISFEGCHFRTDIAHRALRV